MVQVIRAFCWHQKFVPKGFSAITPGLYTGIKSFKMCLKSYFKQIVLKLATNGQSDKGFLLTSTFVPKGLSPCRGAIYMYKSIKIYNQDQVSGEHLQDHWSTFLSLLFCKTGTQAYSFLFLTVLCIKLFTRRVTGYLLGPDCKKKKKVIWPGLSLIAKRALTWPYMSETSYLFFISLYQTCRLIRRVWNMVRFLHYLP